MNASAKTTFIHNIQAYQGLINGVCNLYYQGEAFKDIRQEVLLQLWRAYPTFRQECKISTWIYKVALNTILKAKRKENRTLSFVTITKDHYNNPPSIEYSDDDIQQLHYAINQLPPLDKAIVILYLEGYKNREIANILDITPSNVSTRFNRIKTRLKKTFKTIRHGFRPLEK